MADSDLIARREARRRRILDNSESRLQKLFGKQPTEVESAVGNDETTLHSSALHANGKLPIFSPNDESQALGSHHLGIGQQESRPIHPAAIPTSEFVDLSDVQNNELLSSIAELLGTVQSRTTDSNFPPVDSASAPLETSSKSTAVQSVAPRRLRIVVLALLVKLALVLNCGFLFADLPLLPFVVAEIAETVLLDRNAEPTASGAGILGIVLMLCGILPRKATLIISFFNSISKIVQNFSIYFFTLVVFHAILDWPG